MTKEKIIKIIIEQLIETDFKTFKSYKYYKEFSNINAKFFATLNKEQKNLYLQTEDIYLKYLNLKEEETVEFVINFYKSIL